MFVNVEEVKAKPGLLLSPNILQDAAWAWRDPAHHSTVIVFIKLGPVGPFKS